MKTREEVMAQIDRQAIPVMNEIQAAQDRLAGIEDQRLEAMRYFEALEQMGDIQNLLDNPPAIVR